MYFLFNGYYKYINRLNIPGIVVGVTSSNWLYNQNTIEINVVSNKNITVQI